MTGRGPRGERGEQAAKIIAAACRSFATRGYAATSLRSVAQDAGVDPGLVHYYFRTKTGLLEAVIQPHEAFGAAWPLPPSSPYTSADAQRGLKGHPMYALEVLEEIPEGQIAKTVQERHAWIKASLTPQEAATLLGWPVGKSRRSPNAVAWPLDHLDDFPRRPSERMRE